MSASMIQRALNELQDSLSNLQTRCSSPLEANKMATDSGRAKRIFKNLRGQSVSLTRKCARYCITRGRQGRGYHTSVCDTRGWSSRIVCCQKCGEVGLRDG